MAAIETTYIGRNPWVRGLAALPFAFIPVVLGIAAYTGIAPIAFGTLHCVLFGTVFSLVAYQRNPWPRMTRATLDATEREVVVRDGAGEELRRLPRERIASGYVVPRTDGTPRVRIDAKGATPRVELEVPNVGKGEEILRALALDAGHAAADFRTHSFVYGRPGLVVAASVALGMMSGAMGFALAHAARGHGPAQVVPLVIFALFAMVFAFTGVLAWPGRAIVGADGLYTKWAWRKNFVPHEDIESVNVTTPARFGMRRAQVAFVDVKRRSGGVVRIPVRTPFGRMDEAMMVEERIREAGIAGRHDHADASHAAALLARGDATVRAWIDALRGIGAGVTTLRTAAVTPDALWKVLLDGAAAARDRVAAAVALAPELDAEGKERVRVAARATASPKLRVALEAAAEADDDALERAIADVEADAPAKTARAT